MPRLTHTHTCSVLEVSASTYKEIHDKLKTAGYDHIFNKDDEYGETIDLAGIMLAAEKLDPQEQAVNNLHDAMRGTSG